MKRPAVSGDMGGMPRDPITCAQVDELDLDTRFLADALTDDEALAFEAHYFGCDRCWSLLRRGATLSAALTGGATDIVPARAAGRAGGWYRAGWIGLAAAVLLAIGLGRWVTSSPPLTPPTDDDALRGTGGSLAVTVTRTNDRLLAGWSSAAGATSYRVRVYAADGQVRLERSGPDTSVALPVGSVGAGRADDRLFLQVEARDELERPVARSELTPLILSPPGR